MNAIAKNFVKVSLRTANGYGNILVVHKNPKMRKLGQSIHAKVRKALSLKKDYLILPKDQLDLWKKLSTV